MKMQVQFLALLSELGIWGCHELRCRLQTWFRFGVAVAVWHRPEGATLIRPLTWELLNAADAALKRKTKQNKIPRYFILFHAVVNGSVSLISLSANMLLVYSNATDF